ncbi:hypothetical protein SAMN02799624_05348 [Paenibacillus sp. UNC496MF]|uniref:hypothetical protein n=1 Tax=Paenibacillus sp. UNC496MF TaxID=1502753 RepID=UPI0008F38FCB|nr:hypothetical protein [Paenibacillus sp. UNC496MF]SFJ64536.1 hypothetical protein SAMN02799624_05348 [Paenibacillus sp. UNC496MF]
MKQIQECLDRLFAGQAPIKQKWQARLPADPPQTLFLFHYHHLVLVYDLSVNRPIYRWWEKQADKRGLDSALIYLEQRGQGKTIGGEIPHMNKQASLFHSTNKPRGVTPPA